MVDFSKRFVLFHTEGCHLCEIAQGMVAQESVDYHHKDICDDEQLAEKYGVSIPVFYDSLNNKELFWPFEQNDVQKFIGA
ncbi:MAG: glutaredoxin family protein [Shewanella sp.]|nr:glutaredoxin family protein [Shewanella sp.]